VQLGPLALASSRSRQSTELAPASIARSGSADFASIVYGLSCAYHALNGTRPTWRPKALDPLFRRFKMAMWWSWLCLFHGTPAPSIFLDLSRRKLSSAPVVKI